MEEEDVPYGMLRGMLNPDVRSCQPSVGCLIALSFSIRNFTSLAVAVKYFSFQLTGTTIEASMGFL
jgi:hypothetical protein